MKRLICNRFTFALLVLCIMSADIVAALLGMNEILVVVILCICVVSVIAHDLLCIKEAESYDESYSQIYRFKMQILDKMGKTDECVDAALKYVETDDDAPLRLIAKYAGKHYTYAVAKIKAEMNNQNASGNWIALLTILYENHHDFAKAIELYDKAENEYGANATLYLYRSDCYKEMGEYQKAIKDLTKAIEIAPDEEYFKASRGDVYRNAGMYDKAIADYTACIEKDPLRGSSRP